MLQPNQLWNYQSDRQVETAAADAFVSTNLKWMDYGARSDHLSGERRATWIAS